MKYYIAKERSPKRIILCTEESCVHMIGGYRIKEIPKETAEFIFILYNQNYEFYKFVSMYIGD